MNNRRLIVLYGATGVGKTSLSIRLSNYYNAPIVSSDSRQVYRQMTIGTAVPSPEELSAAPHYFIHNKSINERFTAGDFEKESLLLVDQLFESYQNILLVGGSGLYIDALLYGFDDLATDLKLREELNSLPLEILQEKLHRLDPTFYNMVDINNPARIVRALEVTITSGKPYSEQRTNTVKERNFQIIKIALDRPREELYDRINFRVDQMVEQGLEQEALQLYPHRDLTPLQTVGYQELFQHFDGNISREEAIELIKRNSRRYAKRQGTWLRRNKDLKWFEPSDFKGITKYIDEFIATHI